MFLGTVNSVYIVDKTENNPTQIAGHPAWAAGWHYSHRFQAVPDTRILRVQVELQQRSSHGYCHKYILRCEFFLWIHEIPLSLLRYSYATIKFSLQLNHAPFDFIVNAYGMSNSNNRVEMYWPMELGSMLAGIRQLRTAASRPPARTEADRLTTWTEGSLYGTL